MDSNPHYEILAGERMEPAHGIIHAILAVAFEQRTANLIAAQATPGWLDEVRERLGHPTSPAPPAPEGDEAIDEAAVAVIEDVLQAERVMGPAPRYLAVLLYTRLLREGKLK